jgi:hypothetical protein
VHTHIYMLNAYDSVGGLADVCMYVCVYMRMCMYMYDFGGLAGFQAVVCDSL